MDNLISTCPLHTSHERRVDVISGARRSGSAEELPSHRYGPVVGNATLTPHSPQVPELLGTTENELGIRKWLEDAGHTLVTTSDKDTEGSTFDKELVDAEVIITTP